MVSIKIKSGEEIDRMRAAGQVAAEVLAGIGQLVKAGISTEEIDRESERLIRSKGAEPVFIGYRGYRHATCISINQEVVHGIPGKKLLREGDIVGLDVGVKLNGYCGDNAITLPVGEISAKAKKLLRVGKEALRMALRQARAGNHLGDISQVIQQLAEKNVSRWCATCTGTASAGNCTRIRSFPTSARPGKDRSFGRGWCWRSNRCSIWEDRVSGPWRTGGR